MDRDERPANVLQDIRDLQRDVVQAQGSAPRRPALTQASAGWRLGTTAPDPSELDPGEMWIGAQGGRVVSMDSSGSIVPLEPVPPPRTGFDPGGMSGLSTPNDWPDTYDETYGERVQDDLQMIRLYVLSLRQALVDAGFLI